MSELTLSQVIDAVRDGEHPDYEDLRYAICAMSALMTLDTYAFSKLAHGEQEGKPRKLVYSALFQYEEHFNRTKRAMALPPKQYVGWNNDPDNPDFLARRQRVSKIASKIAQKVAKDRGDKHEH